MADITVRNEGYFPIMSFILDLPWKSDEELIDKKNQLMPNARRTFKRVDAKKLRGVKVKYNIQGGGDEKQYWPIDLNLAKAPKGDLIFKLKRDPNELEVRIEFEVTGREHLSLGEMRD
jgi:hypothetical protein